MIWMNSLPSPDFHEAREEERSVCFDILLKMV